jgi:hypothetical protein
VIAADQVVGDAQEGGAEGAVALAGERAVRFVYLVTLVTGRTQSGASGDGLGVDVVLDGPRLAGEVGGAETLTPGKDSKRT